MKNLILDFYNPDLKILFLVVIVIGVLFFAFRYSKGRKGFFAIFAIRIVVYSLIIFFFLKPVLKWEKEIINNPVVDIWIDNSKSIIKNKDFIKKNFDKNVENIIEKLENEKIEVNLKAFDINSFNLNNISQLKFDGNSTNISRLLSKKDSQIHAAILISDGQNNAGENPYSLDYNFKFPVFCIGIGDTILQNDSKIISMESPSNVKIGDSISISAELSLSKELNRYNILLMQNNEILQSKVINSNEDNFLQTVEFDIIANYVGENEYSIILENDKDKNIHNNKRTRLINVLPGKKNIVIVCNAPSFETRGIQYIFQQNEDFDAKVVYLQNNRWYPNKDILSKKIDLMVLVDFPNKTINLSNTSQIEQILKTQIPVLVFLNKDINIEGLNNLFSKKLIFNYKYNLLKTNVQETKNINPILRDIKEKKNWDELPPIYTDFYSINLNDQFQTILESSKMKNNPIYAINKNMSVGLFVGTDFWRWQFMTENQNYSQLLINSANYLMNKMSNSNVQIIFDKSLYFEGEIAELSGLIYDINGSSIPIADVNITIFQDSVECDAFYLNWSKDKFYGKYLFQKSGEFLVSIKAYKDGEIIGEKIKKIKVLDRVLEFMEIGQNRELLKFIANESGGELIEFDEIDKIIGTINIEQDTNFDKKEIIIDNSKLFFGLLMILLVAEWIIRKYFGYL